MSEAAELSPRSVSLTELPPRDWAAAAETLDRDGVVNLQGAITPAGLQKLEAAIDWSLANPSPSARNFYPDESALFFEDRGQNHRDVARAVGLDSMVAALWGEDQLWYMGEQLFLKQGGFSRRTPWHQDTSYLRMRGSQLIACWISLDPLPKEHCLEFVRGSHRGTLFNGSAFADEDDTAPLYRYSPLPRLPDIQANRDAYDIASWDVTPGDVIIFHLGILHGGAGTAPGLRRRTVSMRFMGPDVVYDGRVRGKDGALAGNDESMADVYAGLKDGDPFPKEHMALA